MAALLYSVSTTGALTFPKSTHSLSSSPSLGSYVHISSSSSSSSSRSGSHVAQARRSGLSSRSRRLEKRGKKGAVTTTEEEEQEEEDQGIFPQEGAAGGMEIGGGGDIEYSKEPMPKLEGLEPDFWEGPQWDAFGFFVQYMWAFGILFGLISGGIAVATYNEGATDFKQTPAYKESIQSQELLEEPDASSADVFEANPTETAPSLE